MIFQSFVYLLAISTYTLLYLSNGANAAPAEDQVMLLPGQKTRPQFRHYSGYLDAKDGRHLHYWFIESELNPASAPLVLWMNGGPGCSSVYGLLTEHGPFRVSQDAKTISMNPYSWNKVANVIYLEAPAGVGFSYSDSKDYRTNDDEVASNNLAALHSFFAKFPEYKSNDFYITGESYGGIYVPTLSVLVLNETFNFKGFAIGNGLHSYELNADTTFLFLAFRGIFSPVTFDNLITGCCEPGKPVTCNFFNVPGNETDCANAMDMAMDEMGQSGINMYNIYSTCQPSKRASFHYLAKQFHPFANLFKHSDNYTFDDTSEDYDDETIFSNSSRVNVTVRGVRKLTGDPPCVDGSPVRKWINQVSVRDALHIPKSVQDWDTCSETVEAGYTSNHNTTFDLYKELLPKVRGLIYHGDTDSMCNYMGGEWFIESLKLPVLEKYRHWTFEDQTAGFVKHFENLTFATVLGSGHMVPTDRPGQALKLFANFLYNKPIN